MTIANPLALERGNIEEDGGGEIFRQPDPRSYFRVMFGLDYRLPDIASGIIREIMRALQKRRGRRLRVLDVGCGYGVLPALIRHPLDMDTIAHRYRDLDWSEIDVERLVELDRHFYAAWPHLVDASFVGYDAHAAALAFSRDVGLIDEALESDFDTDHISSADKQRLAGTDLLVSLNCTDFVSTDAFRRLLTAADGDAPPWCAIFAARARPFEALAAVARDSGLVVEKLPATTFVQRRFASAAEWTRALLALETQGLMTRGKEADGLVHAELYVMRPAEEAAGVPLSDLVSIGVGAAGSYAGWRRRPWGV